MNFLYLKYFCDAVKLESVSKAAKANFVTQSAVSQAIGKLEKMLSANLVAHHPNRFRITPEGEQAFQYAQELLNKAGEFQDNFSEKCRGIVGSLDFFCTYSFGVAVVPMLLKKFRKEHPEVQINFHLGKASEARQMLKTGLVDFAIMPDEGDFPDFENRVVYSGYFCAYKAAQGVAKRPQFILAESVCKETIFFEESYFKKHKKKAALAMRVASWEVIANLTLEGLGIGYIPDFVANNKKGLLKEYPLGFPKLRYDICAIFAKGMRLRKSSELFLSYLKGVL